MWTRQHRKRRTGVLIVPAISALVLSYFGFHAFNGDYGIYSKYRLQDRLAVLETRLAETTAERREMERKVQLMHDGTLERDMVDEQARRALNFSTPDEMTVMRAFIGMD